MLFDFNNFEYISFSMFCLVYISFNIGAYCTLRAPYVFLAQEQRKKIIKLLDAHHILNSMGIVGGLYIILYFIFDVTITIARRAVLKQHLQESNNAVILYDIFDVISYVVPITLMLSHASCDCVRKFKCKHHDDMQLSSTLSVQCNTSSEDVQFVTPPSSPERSVKNKGCSNECKSYII